jgi:23S rRNA (adenine2503-C2)-methyltransferase
METLIGKNTAEIEEALTALGAPAFRGRQLAQSLYKRQARSLDAIQELPQKLRAQLAEQFDVAPSRLRSTSAAPDGTVKYLLDLRDDEVIESVFLPYPGRVSVCIS